MAIDNIIEGCSCFAIDEHFLSTRTYMQTQCDLKDSCMEVMMLMYKTRPGPINTASYTLRGSRVSTQA